MEMLQGEGGNVRKAAEGADMNVFFVSGVRLFIMIIYHCFVIVSCILSPVE